MTKKKRSPEEIVAKLRQVEALRLRGKTCTEAVRSIGVSEVTYRRWRAEVGGLIRTLGPITPKTTRYLVAGRAAPNGRGVIYGAAPAVSERGEALS